MTAQTLSSDFFSNLIASETGNRFSLTEYFSNPCSENYSVAPNMPDLLYYKQITVSAPFSYTISNLNAFCLILTTKGCGELEYNNQLFSLSADTLAFIDCRLLHRLCCPKNMWECTICFVSTSITEFYYGKSCPDHNCLFSLEAYTDFHTLLNQLETIVIHLLIRDLLK